MYHIRMLSYFICILMWYSADKVVKLNPDLCFNKTIHIFLEKAYVGLHTITQYICRWFS